MTEPGYIQPPPPGWWGRTDRIGTGETFIDFETSATGLTAPIDYRPALRIANPNVGPMAMRRKYRRKPISRTRKLLPSFDSAGAGVNSAGPPWSFSHTIGSNATAVIVVINFYNASLGTPTITGNVGGVALTQLSMLFNYTTGGYNAYVGMAGCLNPPTGVQTVTVGMASGTSYSAVNSLSYSNVASFGTPVTATGTGSPSLTVPSASGQMVVNVFSDHTTAFTDYSQSQRVNLAATSGLALVAGDAPGAASVTFTATNANSWGGIGIPLLAP